MQARFSWPAFRRLSKYSSFGRLTLAPVGPPALALRATGTPQLTDIVYVRSADVAPGSTLAGGGLLATAGKQVLFFSRSSGTMKVLFDGAKLGSSAALTSADLIRQTNILMLATAERKLLIDFRRSRRGDDVRDGPRLARLRWA